MNHFAAFPHIEPVFLNNIFKDMVKVVGKDGEEDGSVAVTKIKALVEEWGVNNIKASKNTAKGKGNNKRAKSSGGGGGSDNDNDSDSSSSGSSGSSGSPDSGSDNEGDN
jgi:hypothetical protein